MLGNNKDLKPEDLVREYLTEVAKSLTKELKVSFGKVINQLDPWSSLKYAVNRFLEEEIYSALTEDYLGKLAKDLEVRHAIETKDVENVALLEESCKLHYIPKLLEFSGYSSIEDLWASLDEEENCYRVVKAIFSNIDLLTRDGDAEARNMLFVYFSRGNAEFLLSQNKVLDMDPGSFEIEPFGLRIDSYVEELIVAESSSKEEKIYKEIARSFYGLF